MSAPIAFTWTDEGTFRPLRRFEAQADREFCVGERYLLEPVDERQSARDRAFHAELRDLWTTLPEEYDGRWPTYDEFRGWCLVQCRYATVKPCPCGTPTNAQNVAALFMTMKRKGFAIVNVEGSVVQVIQPLSQALRGGDMTKEQRHESYRDVIDFARGLVGLQQEAA